jgi:hypothetical protein
MEKIRDFLAQMYDRISSPLLFSFLLSWMVINWRITVPIVFYTHSELVKDGYTSYTNLILRNSESWRMFWFPLLIASFYTFIYPFINTAILVFIAWLKGIRTTYQIRVTKDSKVPMSRFLRLNEDLKKQSDSLENLMTSEASLLIQKNELEIKANNSVKEIERMRIDHDENLRRSRVEYFDGDFRITILMSNDKYEEVPISFTKGVIRKRRNDGGRIFLTILDYSYNIETKEFIWHVKDETPNATGTFICVFRPRDLRMNKFHDLREGAVITDMIRE